MNITQIDSHTNLPNRTYLLESLENKLLFAKQNQELTALIFIEFDDLSRFNENFGFDIDDKLILQLAVDNLVKAIDDLLLQRTMTNNQYHALKKQVNY